MTPPGPHQIYITAFSVFTVLQTPGIRNLVSEKRRARTQTPRSGRTHTHTHTHTHIHTTQARGLYRKTPSLHTHRPQTYTHTHTHAHKDLRHIPHTQLHQDHPGRIQSRRREPLWSPWSPVIHPLLSLLYKQPFILGTCMQKKAAGRRLFCIIIAPAIKTIFLTDVALYMCEKFKLARP